MNLAAKYILIPHPSIEVQHEATVQHLVYLRLRERSFVGYQSGDFSRLNDSSTHFPVHFPVKWDEFLTLVKGFNNYFGMKIPSGRTPSVSHLYGKIERRLGLNSWWANAYNTYPGSPVKPGLLNAGVKRNSALLQGFFQSCLSLGIAGFHGFSKSLIGIGQPFISRDNLIGLHTSISHFLPLSVKDVGLQSSSKENSSRQNHDGRVMPSLWLSLVRFSHWFCLIASCGILGSGVYVLWIGLYLLDKDLLAGILRGSIGIALVAFGLWMIYQNAPIFLGNIVTQKHLLTHYLRNTIIADYQIGEAQMAISKTDGISAGASVVTTAVGYFIGGRLGAGILGISGLGVILYFHFWHKDKSAYQKNQIGDDWRDLASKFSKFPSTYVRADWYSETMDWEGKPVGEHWDIRDEWNRQFADDCEVLCKLAGAMLLKSPKIAPTLSQKVSNHSGASKPWHNVKK